MKLRFKHQPFQAEAAKAVCDVFAGQPFRAPLAISHASTSWLSREIILFCLFAVLALLNVLAGKPSPPLVVAAALAGVLGVIVQGCVYAPVSLPALGGGQIL